MHAFAVNVPAVMNAFPPIVVRAGAVNAEPMVIEVCILTDPVTAEQPIETFVAFGAIIDNDASGDGFKTIILVASVAIIDITGIPVPKEIELTANAVKSITPIPADGVILKAAQRITLGKDITTPTFLDALEVTTGVNKMLPTDVRLGIS